MIRIRKLSMAFVMILLVLNTIFSAAADIPEVKYKLYFDKAPKNTFYFSDPLNPTVEYSSASTGGGIQFTLPDTSLTGAPSTASIGIYYNLESKATLKLWFNSSINKDDSARLKGGDETAPSYLNFLIGIGTDAVSAQADLEGKPDYADFDGGLFDLGCKDPVLTVYSNTADPGGMPENVFYENSGSKVLKMLIKQPKKEGTYTNYMGGQYKGYVIMELTTE